MTIVVGNTSWERFSRCRNGESLLMAGAWRDRAGGRVMALVGGRRGSWHWRIERYGGALGTARLAEGDASNQLEAMRAALEAVRDYFHAGKGRRVA